MLAKTKMESGWSCARIDDDSTIVRVIGMAWNYGSHILLIRSLLILCLRGQEARKPWRYVNEQKSCE